MLYTWDRGDVTGSPSKASGLVTVWSDHFWDPKGVPDEFGILGIRPSLLHTFFLSCKRGLANTNPADIEQANWSQPWPWLIRTCMPIHQTHCPSVTPALGSQSLRGLRSGNCLKQTNFQTPRLSPLSLTPRSFKGGKDCSGGPDA